MEEWITKLTDYGVLGIVVVYLTTQVISRLDRIERSIEDMKDELRRKTNTN